ncbi:ribosomal-protein-alanine N-acetyltransferase [Methylobacterium sp. 174MFSha1.1]|uniref:GNAT family N-acetyltransferase n=1 Tax=Methylobacterium sp. 174MFSha1.1 TaxID=1502749 RepID=UPI0008E915A0|nr:GNAT family N-acetyltransferase [Methylobacterium sp. 174MFSha1.1]SFU65059.1 ribosomal-protein-alanine N-acetyltransferase [Methylobacterium sp. 174MFSha1.1]
MTGQPPPTLDTPRLHLRPVAPDDAEATSALMTPAVSRWLASWPLSFTVAMARERIAMAQTLAEAGQALSLAVTARESGELLGWIMLHRSRDDPRTATLGYWLGEAHQRRGYLREAATTLLPVAAAWLDVHRIEASAHPENAGSFAVMRACGMTFQCETVIHAPARSRDEPVHVYAVARDALTPPSGIART